MKEYLVDLHATNAAIRAQYSPKTARKIASFLLTRTDIQAAIGVGRAALSKKLDLSQERVLSEYARVGFSDISDFVEITKDGFKVKPTVLDETGALRVDTRCIAEISETQTEGSRTIKIKLHNKLAALDAIRDTLGYRKEPTDADPKGDRLPRLLRQTIIVQVQAAEAGPVMKRLELPDP